MRVGEKSMKTMGGPVARWQVVTVFAATLVAGIARASTHDACTQLVSLRLPDTVITQAQWVQAGSFQIPPPAPGVVLHPVRLPAHCRVTGSIKPTADSDIRFEVWLPASAWDHRYQQVGNGGLAGSINYADMVTALLRGSATASTDDGHVSRNGFDGRWALGHPEKLIDYGYRAVHLTALAGQAIVQAYYGR